MDNDRQAFLKKNASSYPTNNKNNTNEEKKKRKPKDSLFIYLISA